LASSKEYLQFILDQLSDLEGITHHQMMWEYILYFHWKIIGGIYDNRLLLKPTNIVKETINELEMEIPYPWAKPMVYVDNVDNSDYLQKLIRDTYEKLYWNNSKIS